MMKVEILSRFSVAIRIQARWLCCFSTLMFHLISWSQSNLHPIGVLRGAPSTNPASPDKSPAFLGKTVQVQGVVHQKLLWRSSSSGQLNHAFLIQNLPGHADQNPETSDGLFVYTGNESIPHIKGYEPYIALVGDRIQIQGVIAHRFGQTELIEPKLVGSVQKDVNLANALPLIELEGKLSDALPQSLRAFESLEGMRVSLYPGAVVQSGRTLVGAGQEAYLWVLPGTHPVAERNRVYHNRVFRDAHPLDDVPGRLFDNMNGFRILFSSLGIKGATRNVDAFLPPARSGDRIRSAISGGVVYSYGHYKVLPDQVPEIEKGPDPSMNLIDGISGISAKSNGFRMVTYNL